MNNIIDWAKKEVELVIEKGKESGETYSLNSYDIAINALISFCNGKCVECDTEPIKWIFNRLITRKPLTPIEDVEEAWDFVCTDEEGEHYRCNRMRGLIKNILIDGTIKYLDLNECVCADIRDYHRRWYNGFVHNIYSEIHPITMPYMPADTPDIVVCEEFLTDSKNGDYDTLGILYVDRPSGEEVDINRYFKDSDISFEEISLEEFNKRRILAFKKIYKS